jgi:hypothetical protein
LSRRVTFEGTFFAGGTRAQARCSAERTSARASSVDEVGTDMDDVVGDNSESDQRRMPADPLYLDRHNPCLRLRTLMRPSQPVRHF